MSSQAPCSTNHEKPIVNLVVLDFDDTLYDWIGHFVPALDAMIKAAAPLLDVTEETVREELKAVHEYYGNTEHPFALLETRSAQSKFGALSRGECRNALAPAFAAFDKVRAETLKLYNDVVPALTKLLESGVPVVGYSAATSVNIAKRIEMLGIEPFFDRVYASPFTGMPYPGRRPGSDRRVPITELKEAKPNPSAVTRIMGDFGVQANATLFVGDSVASDIAPALAGGALAALIQRSGTSTIEWLPNLLEVSHRRAETRADVGSVTDNQLSQVPVLDSLNKLWGYFLFVADKESSKGFGNSDAS